MKYSLIIHFQDLQTGFTVISVLVLDPPQARHTLKAGWVCAAACMCMIKA